MTGKIMRGDMFYADLTPGVGSEQSGYRPILIISNDTGNRHSRTIIAAIITSRTAGKSKLPTHCRIKAQQGIGRDSYVLLEQIRTLDKTRLREYIGSRDTIVSREDWQKCADMNLNLGRVRGTLNEEISIFGGLLRCRDCGYKMARTGTYYDVKRTGERKLLIAYNCGAYANMGKTACCSHYILESDLREVVLDNIREKAGFVLQDEQAARERFYVIKSRSDGTQRNADKAALKKAEKRLSELDKLIQAAFEKSVLDSAFTETFEGMAHQYEAEKRELAARMTQLTMAVERHSRTENDVDTFIALMEKYSNITDLDRATVVELIDHITVNASKDKPREITIYYNFIGSME